MNEDKKPIKRLEFGILLSILVAGAIVIIVTMAIFLYYFVKNFISLFK